MGLIRGLNRGLGDGAEGSGIVIGFVLPIAILILIISVGAIWFNGCFNKKPPLGTCSNYSYEIGILDKRDMSCRKWPEMEMRIEKRIVKSDIVHCRCTEGSFPPAEKR